jgi:hypothetical protein
VWHEGVHRVQNKAEIRLAVLVQGGRDTQDQGVYVAGAGEVGSWLEPAFDSLCDAFGGDMLDIGLTPHEGVDFFLVDVEPYNLIADLRISEGQRQTDIAQPDDADHSSFIVQFFQQCVFVHRKSRLHARRMERSFYKSIGPDRIPSEGAIVPRLPQGKISPAHKPDRSTSAPLYLFGLSPATLTEI